MTYAHGKLVNTYIVYGISKHFNKNSYPALENCLFGAATLPKNADINKYRYLGYSIGFDRKGTFSFYNRFGWHVITFCVEMSSYVHPDNYKKRYFDSRWRPYTRIRGTALTAKKHYSILLKIIILLKLEL